MPLAHKMATYIAICKGKLKFRKENLIYQFSQFNIQFITLFN